MLRRAVVVVAGLLGVCCVVLALGVGSALGAVSHQFVSSFTGVETPAGSFSEVGALAVDGASGDVYVADKGHGVLDKFTAGGEYVCQITGSALPSLSECNGAAGSATPAGGIVPRAVAVDDSGNPADPSLGDVYVVDSGSGVVDKFSGGGEYLGPAAEGFPNPKGVGVDGGGGVWVSGGSFFTPLTEEFDSSGQLVGHFPSGMFDGGFAVDSTGFTYTSASGFGLEKFSPDGAPLGTIDGATPVAVGTDLSSDDVFADHGKYVAEYDAQGTPLVQFASEQLESGGSGGVGVDPVKGTVFVSNAPTGKVYVFAATPGPRAVAKPATSVGATSAMANGTVDPVGSDTTYQFQYGTSTSYGQVTPASPADVGAGTSPVAVTANLGGLENGTTYHYRIVASNANGTVVSGDRSFATLPAPAVDGVAAVNLTATSVDLTAKIDPRGYDSTYHLEYGSSTAYGTSVPVPDVDLGAGTSDVSVTVHVSGLSANTTYHWRVVARNVNGITTGADHTFVYDTTGGGLPDGRAYELVTPPFKNGALVTDTPLFGLRPDISEDGSRVIFTTIQCFGGASSCPTLRGQLLGTPYEFSRAGGGWATTPLAPPATQHYINTNRKYSANAGTALFSASTPPTGQDDFYARGADGSFVDVGPITPPSSGPLGAINEYLAATADLSHVVYEVPRRAGWLWPFDVTGLGGNEWSLYEYVGSGNSQPELVGVSGGAGSTDLIGVCGTDIGEYGPLSADGRTVYFTVHACAAGGSGVNAGVAVPANELDARIDGSRTVKISERSSADCTGVCLGSPPANAIFVGASNDGSKAFFTSVQQLTNGASEDSAPFDATEGKACSETAGVNGCNLYEYDFAAPSGHNLIAVSAGDSSGGGPRVRKVVAVSADGSHVYFVAQGVLSTVANGEGQVARGGAENLYVFERDARYPEGRVSFIATLAPNDQDVTYLTPIANVTPDGRFLVFTSHAVLTSDDTSTGGGAQVFRYDASTGVLVRISVGERGFGDNGNAGVGDAFIVPAFRFDQRAGSPRSDPTMSHDGSFVFFMSPVALTPRALNDVQIGTSELGRPEYAENVYEWHEGHVYLISDGRDVTGDRLPPCEETGQQSSVCLLGTDGSGANVFFMTADSLVAQDADTELDIYDARVCTSGDPCVSSPPPTTACAGEACRGAVGVAPVFGSPASTAFSGAGNLVTSAGPVAKAKKKPAKARKKPRRKHPRKKRGKAGKTVKRGRK